MAASKNEISRWFDAGVARGHTHMIIVWDTFDNEDYPVYIPQGEDVHDRVHYYEHRPMQRVMEVYALHLNKQEQLDEWRSFHYENAGANA